MKVTFLGTRGEIDARTPQHAMHSALMVTSARKRIMVDCGADWVCKVQQVNPDAIVITHAHPDHVNGLRYGVPCPVYASAETFSLIAHLPIVKKVVVEHRNPFHVGPVRFEAFALEHSIRAPAVGYVASDDFSFFYAPDVAAIDEPHAALTGIELYVGDGAAITRPILRKRGGVLIGHASMKTQLEWCKAERVSSAIFTHCGKAIVAGDPGEIQTKIDALCRSAGMDVRVAIDGMEIRIARGALRFEALRKRDAERSGPDYLISAGGP